MAHGFSSGTTTTGDRRGRLRPARRRDRVRRDGSAGDRARTRRGNRRHTNTDRFPFLGLFEDIFDWAGQKRHELFLVYDVDLADRVIYDAEEVEVVEPDGTTYPARWRSLGEFRTGARLVPDGLLDLVSEVTRRRRGD
jgi:hypothetical protein